MPKFGEFLRVTEVDRLPRCWLRGDHKDIGVGRKLVEPGAVDRIQHKFEATPHVAQRVARRALRIRGGYRQYVDLGGPLVDRHFDGHMRPPISMGGRMPGTAHDARSAVATSPLRIVSESPVIRSVAITTSGVGESSRREHGTC